MSNQTEWVRRLLEPAYYRFYLLPKIRIYQEKQLRAIRKRGQVRLTFLVSSLPMWRFQSIFDRLRTDERFDLSVAILPFPGYSKSQKESAVQELGAHFKAVGASIIDLSEATKPGTRLREQVDPDVIFYPQPYNHLFENDMDSTFFMDKLLCYIPYGMLTVDDPWAFRSFLCNVAWRLLLGGEARFMDTKSILYNKGKNIRFTGDPMADIYCRKSSQDPWKSQLQNKKRVIWAPHFSIVKNDMLTRDSFSWLHQLMLDIAQQYQDRIQFAFKPHPRLFTELCNHPSWGKERAEEYYNLWKNGPNTQLETGPYVDLFKGSDAMIHDSGSFTAEYHYTGRPVLFTTQDMSMSEKGLNVMGKAALRIHYQGKSKEDIIHFLDNVVLKGEDSMQARRLAFRNKFLTIPEGKNVADNVYNELVSSIWK